MPRKSTSHRKPNLLVLLTLTVGVSVLATGIAQASERPDAVPFGADSRTAGSSEKWWQSIWGLDLSRKLREWQPKITVRDEGEGFNLAHPFGKSGPTIRCSSSLPDAALRSLRANGDPRFQTLGQDTDIFVFLQKRW